MIYREYREHGVQYNLIHLLWHQNKRNSSWIEVYSYTCQGRTCSNEKACCSVGTSPLVLLFVFLDVNSIPDPFSVKKVFLDSFFSAERYKLTVFATTKEMLPFLGDTTTFKTDALCLHVRCFIRLRNIFLSNHLHRSSIIRFYCGFSRYTC